MLEQEKITMTTRNPIWWAILILCIQLGRHAAAGGTNELERYHIPIPGRDSSVMFKAESMGLRSTGGTVPRRWDVFILPEDGQKMQRITNMQFDECAGLDVSPDGSKIVFSARVNQFPKDSFFVLRLAAIKTINPEDKRFVGGTVILDTGKHHIEPRFSPDGNHVVFLSNSQRSRTLAEALTPFSGTVKILWEVCIIDLHTLSVTVIDRSNNAIAGHGFSGDGKTIAYTKDGKACNWSIPDTDSTKTQ